MSALDLSSLFASKEEFADGERHQEMEYCFYGKLDDFAVLGNAAKSQEQEQWNIPLESDNTSFRVRMINNEQHVQTVKTKKDGVPGKTEVEDEISANMYNAIQQTATLGYRKTRYFFPVEGSDLVWEVDVFKDVSGNQSQWIKLDLEVPSPDTKLPPLPFELNDKIVAQGKNRDDAEEAQIDRLWQVEWNIKKDRPIMVTEGDDETQPASSESTEPEAAGNDMGGDNADDKKDEQEDAASDETSDDEEEEKEET